MIGRHRFAQSRSRLARLRCFWGLLVLAGVACAGDQAVVPSSQSPVQAAPWFEEVGAAVGLVAIHHTGATGQYFFPEITTGGVALFDFDGDGDLDVWLGGSGPLDSGGVGPHGRLYRNDLIAGRPETLVFVDVTQASGITPKLYETGVAVGDLDGDGWPDLYLVGFGRSEWWRNQGDGTFGENAVARSVAVDGWTAGAAIADLDRDGDQDLVVVEYVDWTVSRNKPCRGADGLLDYCGPLAFRPTPDHIFLAQADGSFESAAGRLGLLGGSTNGLAVAVLDLSGDGLADIYVASDQLPNRAWVASTPGGRYRDLAPELGLAVNAAGIEEASMGIAVGDLDGDLLDDLVVTHLTGETTTFYRQVAAGVFQDRTQPSGIGRATRSTTAFGIVAVDLEGDTDLDLVIANGAVYRKDGLGRGSGAFPYQQPDLVLANRGDGVFDDASAAAGDHFAQLEVGRGLAAGDIDNDGDVDLLVGNAEGPARLLRNLVGNRAGWLGLRLLEGPQATDAEGVVVIVELADGRRLRRSGRRAQSYASASDPRVVVGLGGATVVGLEVWWPDGQREQFGVPPTGQWTTLVRGSGT